MQTPNPMLATKEAARRMVNIFRKNPRRASQVVFIIAGAIGLISVISFWDLGSSNSILVLRSQNGRLDENATRRAVKAYQNEQKQGMLKSLSISVLTSVLLVGLIELLAVVIENLATADERKRFVRFFGKGTLDGEGMKAIFFTAVSSKNNYDWVDCPNKPPKAQNAKVQGVNHVVPFEELKAVLEVQRLFDSMGAKFQIDLDSNIHNCNALPSHSVLAIGLGFNYATYLIQECCRPLFEVFYTTDENLGAETVDFMVDKVEHEVVKKDSDYDYALFARVFKKEGGLHLICAGRTANGTEAACKFLAKNWAILASQYENDAGKGKHNIDEQSMAVVLRHHVNNLDNCSIQRHAFAPENP
jgi:hypothetical protein